MFRYLRGVLFWITFVSLTFFLFIWLLCVVAYYRLFDRQNLSSGAHRVAISWGRAIMFFTPGWSYTLHGRENLPQAGEPPVVMVANHQSAADIWALYLTGAQFRWLSKDAVFKVPLIGLAMRWAGYVPIARGRHGSHAAAMRASAAWIRRGVSMVFFPEGTRSEDGRLREFKIGAFRLAVDEKVDVLPILIQGTRNMVQKKGGAPAPAHLDILIMPRTPLLLEETIEAYALRVQKLLADKLEDTGRDPQTRPEAILNKKVPQRGPAT